jgi:hypothetical protein
MALPQRGPGLSNGGSNGHSAMFNSVSTIYTQIRHGMMRLPALIQKRKGIPVSNGLSLRFIEPSAIQRPVVATVVLILTILYVLLLILTEHELHNSEENHPSALLRKQIALPISMDPVTLVRHIQSQVKDQVVIPDTDLYISFNANIGGQGTGNIISGLLAAHLLGLEFHRIVCVHPMYDKFLSVFEYVHPEVEAKCAAAYEKYSDTKHSISLINFVGAADECELQNIMSNTNIPLVTLIANTYPRWPSVPANFFFHHYQPKPVLLEALPYKVHPKTVVHLRQPDNQNEDRRSGLDEDSLTALGNLLPADSSTFLVTNNVIFYERFEQCCNWDHPQWNIIVHSAFELSWSAINVTEASRRYDQNIRMWVDWYTILTAKTVYHTHSDFSISAIHWVNNMDSHSIVGYNRNSGQFETTDESWRRDGETIPMSQRTLQGSPGTTHELRACQEDTRRETAEREAKGLH